MASAIADLANSLRLMYPDALDGELTQGATFLFRVATKPRDYKQLATGREVRDRLQREMFGGDDGSLHDYKCVTAAEQTEKFFYFLALEIQAAG